MSSTLFGLEYLQKLVFERSKAWATFMDNVAKKETLLEINLNEFDSLYGPECDEDDTNEELASMEEDECDDIKVGSEILRSVSNTTRLSLFLNNQSLAVPQINTNEPQNEFIDIFNQTLPIINESNRQLQEAGLDKILSSFDKQKIEDKVGSWLCRHNSLYGGDNTLLSVMTQEPCKKERPVLRTTSACRFKTPISRKVNDDSDDSLQSGETARYIRSSRAGVIRSSASSSTMIKTFRMVKSSREALREKYAFEKDDDDYLLKTIDRRRKIAIDQEYRHNRYDITRLQSLRKHEMHPLSSQKQRRKVLRKRTCGNSCSAIESSSDSDCYYNYNRKFHRKKQKHFCNQGQCSAENYSNYQPVVAKKLKTRRSAIMPSARRNRMYYFSSQTKSFSTSSSSTSFGTVYERHRPITKTPNFRIDEDRPYKRESECSCCSDKQLCGEYRHVTDTSTDAWYVENCYSPKRIESKSFKSPLLSPDKLPALTDVASSDTKTKQNLKNDSSKILLNATEVPKSKAKASATKNIAKNLTQSGSESSDWELKLAIQESKKTYSKELEMKECKVNVEKKAKHNIKQTKLLRKTSKNQKESALLNHATHKKSIKKFETNKDGEVFQNLPKMAKSSNSEEAFFTSQAQEICNSTALQEKSQAYNRQIAQQFVNKSVVKGSRTKIPKTTKSNLTTKKLLPTSSMENEIQRTCSRTRKTTTTLTATPNEIKPLKQKDTDINGDDNNDCTQVTSTTNIELSPPKLCENINDSQQENSTSDSNHRLPQKGILIYAPENRNIVPAYNVTNDAYFTITKEHLSKVIGEKPAEKFLKYYIGRKRFNSNSAVYYIPPTSRVINTSHETSSSNSSDDLDNLGQYGDLYEESPQYNRRP